MKTKAPTGISIARSGSAFAVTWKIGDADYGDGQAFQWCPVVNGTPQKWTSLTVANTATSKSITVTPGSYYPTGKTLTGISVRIRGNRRSYTADGKTIDPDVSDWREYTHALKIPASPSLSAALSSNQSNVTTFTWATKTDNNVWFRDVEYETMLLKNCTETDGSKLRWIATARGWQTGTGGASGTKTITEDTATLATGSFTRWLRIRARSTAGASAWRYAKHVYANPKAAVISETKIKGLNVTALWTAQSSAAYPIDLVTVQYSYATPNADLACPSGASWTTAATSKDTSGKDAATFPVNNLPGENQCLYVRVNTTHDRTTVNGSPKLVKAGKLSTPTNVSVTSAQQAVVQATNTSPVPDSFLVVRYLSADKPFNIGIIPHGSSQVTIQCPTGTTPSVAVYAAQGSYTATTRADGVTSYAVKANMSSDKVTAGGSVPAAPTITAEALTGAIGVTWTWPWTDATEAELSWSDNPDAWESTAQPQTYIVGSAHASRWIISNLGTGKWYVRVRLINGETYGEYSDIQEVDLATAPVKPVLTLSSGIVTDTVTASWVYMSSDGTMQSYAEIEDETGMIGHTETAQHIDIDTTDWAAGETHGLRVRVVSESGLFSDWSDYAYVTKADAITAAISQDSLVSQIVTTDGVTRNVNALTTLPMTVTVTGAGAGGTTTVIIERAAAYHVDRPDETTFYGFEGETIAQVSQQGEAQITIDGGTLDDEAQYRLIATVQDGYGQSAEVTKDFEVHWAHQAAAPTAQVTIDGLIAKLKPIAPSGSAQDDVCDIYRLSADKPVLIYPGAAFGGDYVDPYPTIGEYGGYRFVTRTANGDYITSDHKLAWTDVQSDLDIPDNIIDYGAGRVLLRWDIDLGNRWQKDFSETKYLGGAVQGDWNPAVSRKTTLTSVAVTADDQETILSMRRLAAHAGVCHVRTKDGSSFAADVQVSEDYKQNVNQKLVSFSLSITRVDPDGYDGMTLTEWEQTDAVG